MMLTGFPDSPLVGRARHLNVNCILMKGKATAAKIADEVKAELQRLPSWFAKSSRFVAA